MKYIIALYFIIISSTAFYGKNNTKIITQSDTIKPIEKAEDQPERENCKIIQLPNETLNVLVENKTEKKSSFDIQKNMPWIGAILIGILTVLANYIINIQIRKTNTESIDKQLINAREINQKDFNKTVLSGNRQAWINDLRDIISKVLSKILSLSLKGKITHDELQELIYLITKAELMLNPEKDKLFIKSLKELELCFIDIQREKKTFSDIEQFTSSVKKFTKRTLKTEWERVKRGE
jgi:hypothetical protein